MQELIYRNAKPEDAEAMIAHMRSVGGETDFLTYGADTFNISPSREASFISRFTSSQNSLMTVAVDPNKGRIAGAGIIEQSRIRRMSHTAELSITVLKEYWGRGVGSHLMEIMIDHSRSVGLRTLTLYVREDNIRAISLYRKYGFVTLGTLPDSFEVNGQSYGMTQMYKTL